MAFTPPSLGAAVGLATAGAGLEIRYLHSWVLGAPSPYLPPRQLLILRVLGSLQKLLVERGDFIFAFEELDLFGQMGHMRIDKDFALLFGHRDFFTEKVTRHVGIPPDTGRELVFVVGLVAAGCCFAVFGPFVEFDEVRIEVHHAAGFALAAVTVDLCLMDLARGIVFKVKVA